MDELTEEEINNFMGMALEEAELAKASGEVPIGAVLVDENGQVVARSHNMREEENRAASHAEMNVIELANKKLNSWRLLNTRLFVTVEPCLMCSGAIIQSRIPEVYYGSPDSKFGAVESLYQTLTDPRSNHRVTVHGHIREDESAEIMQSFFQTIRDKRK
ncbi:MAG: nucleoside deaminase [Lactobacillaceae bacterium]|jgi:tRNA(adenine34) deaminase|nr:nucleoside deaminase [Lactobacillaceae bacterium]